MAYDLEERTAKFAGEVRGFVRRMRQSPYDIDDIRQLIRSSGSVGANYIEANEALGKKDFLMHIRICRKEAKESRYWMCLLEVDEGLRSTLEKLMQESTELMKIFGAILRKSE